METSVLSVDDHGENRNSGKEFSSITTFEPYDTNGKKNSVNVDSPILYVESLPLCWSFDIVHETFSKYGVINEIKNRLDKNKKSFQTWIVYDNNKDALEALNSLDNVIAAKCSLVEETPRYLDAYRPPKQVNEHESDVMLRSPDPPRWQILSTHD